MGPVLGSLLPGLREVRAPLAAGYLWIAFGWLALRDNIPAPKSATGLLADTYELAAWLGKPGVVVVTGFTAYLLGVVSVGVTTFAFKRLSRVNIWAGSSADRILYRLGLSRSGVAALIATCYAKVVSQMQDSNNHAQILNPNPGAAAVVKAIASNLSLDEKRAMVAGHVKVSKYFEAIADDFQALPVRLMLERPEAFSSYDRTRAEGEFRGAVVLPIIALAAALYSELLILSVGLLASAVALGVQARRRLVQANDEVAEILRASGGKESRAMQSIVASTIEFAQPELTDEERGKITSLAEAAVEASQPFAAISWYEVLAAAGSREGHERLCDLTREYQYGPLLHVRLGEGARFSGRLAVEFVAYIYDEGDYLSPDGRQALVRGLVWGYKDPEWRNICVGALYDLYFGDSDPSQADEENLLIALERATTSPAALEVMVREWPVSGEGLEGVLSKFVSKTIHPSRTEKTRRVPFPRPTKREDAAVDERD